MTSIRTARHGILTAVLSLLAISAQAGGTIHTFVVNSTADTQTAGTLRQAILDANNSAATDVDIDINLPDGSEILLSSDLPTISHPNVTIANLQPLQQITIDGGGSYRLLRQVGLNPMISVSDIEFRSGWMDATDGTEGGACLFTQGRALVYRARFFNCQTRNGSGAAIHARASLLVEDSQLDDNTVFQDNTLPVSRGGAVYCTGTFCDIRGSSFSDNRVNVQLIGQTERGGGAAHLDAEQISIQDSQFLSNRGLGRGGALYLVPTQPGSSVDISGSLFRENEGGEGGALYVDGNNTESLTIEKSSFERNVATLRGPALVAVTVPQVHLDGNVFYLQESANTAVVWGTVYVFGNSSGSSTVTLDFNTFVGEDERSFLFEANEGGASSDVVVARMHANVFDQRAQRAACREESAQLEPQAGQFNVVTDDSCTGTIEADSLINTDPLLNEAVSLVNHTLVYPKKDSPTVDFVTDESLVNCSGTSDLGGTIRPLDGDNDGLAQCDAGALERNVWIFRDRFEN